MLKRIGVKQLTLGMHIKEFCGSWMDHPFMRSGFVLSSDADLAAILASSIKEVWIDSHKGLDVAAHVPAVTEAESEAEITASLAPVASAKPRPSTLTIEQEIDRAARICAQAKEAVETMFDHVRMGQSVDVGSARLLVEEISGSVARNPAALISLARLKTADNYTYLHSVAVCALMAALARQLGLDAAEIRSAGMAGLMHDLGKAPIPLKLLNKAGKLTEAEFEVIKTHPQLGFRILQMSQHIEPKTLDACLHHHEKMDGSGYPEGLKGDEISLSAKMTAVCDVYDAITSDRPYKRGWDPAYALRQMAGWSRGHFDLPIFHALVKTLGIYPVGALVRMSSGRLGVVLEQSGSSLTTPRIKLFYSTRSALRIAPELLDLSRCVGTDRIAALENPDDWNFPDLQELWSGIRPS